MGNRESKGVRSTGASPTTNEVRTLNRTIWPTEAAGRRSCRYVMATASEREERGQQGRPVEERRPRRTEIKDGVAEVLEPLEVGVVARFAHLPGDGEGRHQPCDNRPESHRDARAPPGGAADS
jgi:hypothetical protein